MWRCALVVTWVAACSYSPPRVGGGGDDTPIDAPPPDVVTICPEVIRGCTGDMLVDCQTVGAAPMTTPCGWGCSETGGAHCLAISPSGGSVTTNDMDPATLGALQPVALANVTINTTNGTISPTVAGFTSNVRSNPNVTVFAFKSVTLTGTITVTGNHAIAIIADGPIVVDGLISAQGCTGADGLRTAGPGGFTGAPKNTDASGNGGGKKAPANTEGAGGGGYGAEGGRGGHSGDTGGGPGGPAFGVATIAILEGGGGGGGGPGGGNPLGGGGGGAIQLVSNTSITIKSGGINAGGCGGGAGAGGPNDGAGGGGAGGAILLEAPKIDLMGSLAVNGGGGGGSGGMGSSKGSDGTLDRNPASGGTAGSEGGGGAVGGAGGAANVLVGGDGLDASRKSGGGGAVGRMRFHTRSGTVGAVDNTKLSPSLDDNPTTCTQGPATIVDP